MCAHPPRRTCLLAAPHMLAYPACTCLPRRYFFDEGSKIEWTPNSGKLSTSKPGVKIAYAPNRPR